MECFFYNSIRGLFWTIFLIQGCLTSVNAAKGTRLCARAEVEGFQPASATKCGKEEESARRDSLATIYRKLLLTSNMKLNRMVESSLQRGCQFKVTAKTRAFIDMLPDLLREVRTVPYKAALLMAVCIFKNEKLKELKHKFSEEILFETVIILAIKFYYDDTVATFFPAVATFFPGDSVKIASIIACEVAVLKQLGHSLIVSDDALEAEVNGMLDAETLAPTVR